MRCVLASVVMTETPISSHDDQGEEPPGTPTPPLQGDGKPRDGRSQPGQDQGGTAAGSDAAANGTGTHDADAGKNGTGQAGGPGTADSEPGSPDGEPGTPDSGPGTGDGQPCGSGQPGAPDQPSQPGAPHQPGGPGGQVPGPALALALRAAAGHDGAGLGGLSDGELLDVIQGGRAMTSWAAWVELAAMAEFGARHPGGKGDQGPFSRGAADEVGLAIRMTWMGAGDRMAFGATLAERLPHTFTALRDGLFDTYLAKIIDDYTTSLTPQDTAEAEKILAAAAASGLTAGQLRARAARLVLRLDPDAATRRREAKRRDASVRVFREDSGNGGITGHEMPVDEVLASWQNIEQRALDLRAMGVEGSLRELQVLATLDLLQERDSSGRLTAQDAAAATAAGSDQDDDIEDDGGPENDQDDTWPQDDGGPEDGAPEDDGPEDGAPEDDGPQGGGGAGPAGPRGPGGSGGTRLAAHVTIVIPWEAWLGLPSGPGEVGRYGLTDPDQTQDLLTAAARDPQSRGCITLLGPDGTAVAHGCGRGPLTLPPRGTERDEPDGPDPPGPAGRRRPAGPATPSTAAQDMIRRLRVSLAPVTQGTCDHHNAEARRLPSRSLRHLIQARNPTCAAPGCGRPALGCEQDHTVAWENGGITCDCNLGPLCRHHHIIKHLPGWRLQQPQPGTFTWRTPAGRTYTTRPAEY